MHDLRIELETRRCSLSPVDLEKLRDGLNPLRDAVETLPSSDLELHIERDEQTGRYWLQARMTVADRPITAESEHALMHYAFADCIRKMVRAVSEDSQTENDHPTASRYAFDHAVGV